MDWPKPIEIGGLTASVMKDREPKGASCYWRARRKGPPRDTIWTGWGTRDEASLVLAGLVARGLPSPGLSRVDAAKTAGDVLSLWVEHQRKRLEAGDIAPRSFRAYEHNARYGVAAFGSVPVAAVCAATIEDAALTWKLLGLNSRSVRYAIAIVRMAMKWARKRKLPVDLLDDVDVPPEGEYIYGSETPTLEQLEAIFGEMGEHRASGRLVRLMAWTGARPGEISAAFVGDVDLEAGTWALHGEDDAQEREGKTGRRVWSIGNGRLRALLESLTAGRAADAYLIPRRGLNLAANVDKALNRACERANVPRFTPHAIRRCAIMATLPYDQGNHKATAQLFGHSVETMMRVYVRPTEDDRAAITERAALDRGPRVLSYEARAQKPGTRRAGTGTDGDAGGDP